MFLNTKMRLLIDGRKLIQKKIEPLRPFFSVQNQMVSCLMRLSAGFCGCWVFGSLSSRIQ